MKKIKIDMKKEIKELIKTKEEYFPDITPYGMSKYLIEAGYCSTPEEASEIYKEYKKRKASDLIGNKFQEFNRQSNAKEIDIRQIGLKKYFFISFNVFGDNIQGEAVNYFGNKVIDLDPMNWQFQNQFKKIGLQIILLSWNQISKEQFEKYQKLFLSTI